MGKIANKIKEIMSIKKLSYRDLEDATGISKAQLQRYASGKTENIPLPNLEKIARALEVSVIYLIGDEHMDSSDAEFIKSLGTIHNKEDVPPEIEAVNTLLYSSGLQIMKTQGKYYFDEAGQLSEEELNEFLNTIISMVHSAADGFIKKKTKQTLINFFGKKD